MKIKPFLVAVSLFISAFICTPALAQTSLNVLPGPYELSGPVFSLDEPWKVSQFTEALVGKSFGFEDATSAKQIETTQGKTIKNEAGKIYYLENEDEYDVNQNAFIGLRRNVNDKQIVSFYAISLFMLHSDGTSLVTRSDHSLNNIYAATYGDQKLQIIEFNQIDMTEDPCREEHFYDCETGEVDLTEQKKCNISKYAIAYRRLAFAIAEDGSVFASSVISEARKVCSDEDICKKRVSRNVKSIKDIKSFNLTKEIVCKTNVPAKKGEAVTLNCHHL